MAIGVQMTSQCNQESPHGSSTRQTAGSLLIGIVNSMGGAYNKVDFLHHTLSHSLRKVLILPLMKTGN